MGRTAGDGVGRTAADGVGGTSRRPAGRVIMDPLPIALSLLAVVAVLVVPAALVAGLVWVVGFGLSIAVDGRAALVRPSAADETAG